MASSSYTISELASEFEVTTRTIRFYEDKGLLTPKRDGQRRIYSASDRVRLILILRGRRLGFSLDESREIIDLYDPVGQRTSHSNAKQLTRYLEKIQLKQSALAKQLKDIKVMQKELKQAELRCLDALKNI